MVLAYDLLSEFPVFAFTSRNTGGVSLGTYDSLNLGLYSGDDVTKVNENKAILANYLQLEKHMLIMPHQTHEDKILNINKEFLALSPDLQTSKLYGIDALITAIPKVCIGVTTADCVPIVLYDKVEHIAGVAHAGWKGTVQRIVSKTVEQMGTYYGTKAEDLIALIGPSISQKAFEVGEEVEDQFLNAGFDLQTISIRNRNTNKLHIDLKLTNQMLLESLGVNKQNIYISPICTVEDTDFYSARRQGFNSGRALTGIILR